jgi:hypothetical protein
MTIEEAAEWLNRPVAVLSAEWASPDWISVEKDAQPGATDNPDSAG